MSDPLLAIHMLRSLNKLSRPLRHASRSNKFDDLLQQRLLNFSHRFTKFIDPKQLEDSKSKNATLRSSKKLVPNRYAFTYFPIVEAERLLDVDFIDVLRDQEIEVEKVIKLKDTPPDLLDDVYDTIAVLVEKEGFYPDGTRNEVDKTIFVRAILSEIIKQVRKDCKLGERKSMMLYINSDKWRTRNPFGVRGRIDFIVQKGVGYALTNLVVLETKAGDVDTALKQLFLYLFWVAKENGDNRPVYGSCTNAKVFNFVVYENKKFRVLDGQRTLFPRMEEKEKRIVTDANGEQKEELVYKYKEHWIQNNSAIVKILYTCLIDSLSWNDRSN